MTAPNSRLNIVIVLLVINLLTTVWLGLATHGRLAALEQAQVAMAPQATPLPEVLDNALRTRLYRAFVANYNARDFNAVYEMLGDYARQRIERDALISQSDRLVKLFGDIEDGSYSHHEYETRSQGVDFIHLIYDLELGDASELGPRAELLIKVLVKDGQYEVYGFTINSVNR